MKNTTCDPAEARCWADVYGVLALGYHAPHDTERLARVEARDPPAGEVAPNPVAEALSSLCGSSQETEAESLRQDFDDLFMVPGPKYVTPYESVYVDGPIADGGDGRVCGPATRSVQAFYDRIGLAVAPGYPELPDFVGLEMACMEYLCTREANYLEAGDGASAGKVQVLRRAFCQDHLMRWIPELDAHIQRRAETAYYRTFAELTSAAVSGISEAR